MCIVCVTVVIAFYRALRMVCLHDVSMIRIGEECAVQEQEEPSHQHVARGCPYFMNRYIRNVR